MPADGERKQNIDELQLEICSVHRKTLRETLQQTFFYKNATAIICSELVIYDSCGNR